MIIKNSVSIIIFHDDTEISSSPNRDEYATTSYLIDNNLGIGNSFLS